MFISKRKLKDLVAEAYLRGLEFGYQVGVQVGQNRCVVTGSKLDREIEEILKGEIDGLH